MPKITNYFIKDEASYSVNNNIIGNYTGLGMKVSLDNCGNFEGMLAFKANSESKGLFGEAKFTSPAILPNIFLESRNRVQLETTGKTFATRFAEKYSKDCQKFNFYEIAGATTKISLEGQGVKSVTPTILAGAGYKISKNLNCYVEGEVSKGYDLKNKEWCDYSPAFYAGIKYNF